MLKQDIRRRMRLTFDTISPDIVTRVENYRVVSIEPLDKALLIEPNLLAINSAVYINANLNPISLMEEDFLVLRDATNSKTIVVAASWINESSLEEAVDSKVLKLVISDLSQSDIDFYNNLVKARGDSFSSTVV